MKKSQIKVFEELLKDNDFKGKKQLKHLLWLNTSKPKYEIGQYVKVTNTSHSVYGYPVVNFKAKITEIRSFTTGEEWYYTMEMDITCGDKHAVIEEYAPEKNIKGGVRNNKNLLGEAKSKHADELSITW